MAAVLVSCVISTFNLGLELGRIISAKKKHEDTKRLDNLSIRVKKKEKDKENEYEMLLIAKEGQVKCLEEKILHHEDKNRRLEDKYSKAQQANKDQLARLNDEKEELLRRLEAVMKVLEEEDSKILQLKDQEVNEQLNIVQ